MSKRYYPHRNKYTKKSRSGFTFLMLMVLAYLYVTKYGYSVDTELQHSFLLGIRSLVLGSLVFGSAILGLQLLKKNRKKMAYINSGISVVDRMDGIEFENFLKAHYEKLGFKCTTTKASNDFGADLIISKNGEQSIIQAKRYKSKVGIKAIQEVVASLKHFNASKAIVVTNNYFTSSAIQLAQSNDVELVDRKSLIDIMSRNNGKNMATDVRQFTLDSMMCPKCENKLIERQGSQGIFLGCSDFPKCRFTREI